MKKLLVFFLMLPTVAWGMNCKSIHDASYQLMLMRQGGFPLVTLMDRADKVLAEAKGKMTPEEHAIEAKFTYEALEMAYRVPSMGMFQEVVHQMATEFANIQYLKCLRINRR